ncbi:MAG: UDP-N-acetylglucosamine 2-epimerase (non-hydrolyzing) [Methylococcales bacterium]
MLKVMTIVGTRPEIIRLSRVIAKLDEHCQHTLVHTGQNFDYELNAIFFEELEIRKPDVFLHAAGETAIETIAQVMVSADKVMADIKPDAVLLLGDTNSALAAISAKRRKIPIFHMEAGNRCFDLRVPEEINRKIIDHIADINLPYSDIAREYLLREGIAPDQIIKTGSPMREVLDFYAPKIADSGVLARMGLQPLGYFLVSVHREENVDVPENLQKLFFMLNSLVDLYQLPVIVSTHPRTRKRIESLGLTANPAIIFSKPFGFIDYIKLQTEAKVVLSDSGTITEEASILNFPALNLRETNERPEGFEQGAVMMVGLNTERVLSAIKMLATQLHGAERSIQLVNDYSVTNVSDKIVRIIMSYTDYVNHKIWKKPTQ